MSTYYTSGHVIYSLTFSNSTSLETLSWNATTRNFLDFNGSTDYVDLSTDVGPFNIGTYSFWIKPNELKTENNIIQGIYYYKRIYIGVGTVKLETDTNNQFFYFDNHSIVVGVWQHITVIKNGDNAYLYLKGTLVSSKTVVGANTLTINRISSEYSPICFNGKIDDVRIWNRVLSPEEVTDCYNGNAPRNGLVAEWLMREQQGNKIYDTSVNSNTGTITGADWGNTKVKFQVKAGDNWYGAGGIDTYFTDSPSSLVGIPKSTQFYIKPVLTTTDATITPTLHDFTIVSEKGIHGTKYDSSSCPRCLGKSYYYDLKITPTLNDVETVVGSKKLGQELVKRTLELPEIQEAISSVDTALFKNKLKSAIIGVINDTMDSQQEAFLLGGDYPDTELIDNVERIEVDQIEPRKYEFRISLITRSGRGITIKESLNLVEL